MGTCIYLVLLNQCKLRMNKAIYYLATVAIVLSEELASVANWQANSSNYCTVGVTLDNS